MVVHLPSQNVVPAIVLRDLGQSTMVAQQVKVLGVRTDSINAVLKVFFVVVLFLTFIWCFACMYVCVRVSDLLELESQMVVSCLGLNPGPLVEWSVCDL